MRRNAETKALLAYSRAWINIYPAPEYRMADAGMRTDPAVWPKYHAVPYHRRGADFAARTDLSTSFNDRLGTHFRGAIDA